MRTLSALALAALAFTASLSGCFGDDSPPRATPAPSDPPAPPPEDESTSPPPAEPPAETPPETPPAEREPVEVLNTTFDYSSGEAAAPDGKEVPFTVGEGFTTLSIRIVSRAKETVPTLAVNAELTLYSPDGTAVLTASPSAGEPIAQEFPAAPGTWKLVFEGASSIESSARGTVR